MMTQYPNVLVLMTDEQRCDSLGCYGSHWARTPHLDQLASQGTRFAQAITPAPVCGPARASLLTGMRVPRTGIWDNNDICDDLPFLTDHFAQAGYQTATFGKQHYRVRRQAFQTEADYTMSDAVKPFGFADPSLEAACKVLHHPSEKRPWILASHFPEDETQTAEHRAVDAAMTWLQSHQQQHVDAPFLLRVSLNAPHTPVCPPVPFDTCIDAEAIDLPTQCDAMPDGAPAWIHNILKPYAGTENYTLAQRQQLRQSYYGFASYADDQFGRLLRWMQSQQLLDNTLIAFVSDHGTHLADYGLVQKQSFYRVSVNVPFVITDLRDSASQPHVVHEPVSSLSLWPTLMQMAGLTLPQNLDAPSLVDAIKTGKHTSDEPVFSALTMGSSGLSADRLVLVQKGDWKLALNVDAKPAQGWLCHLAQDPLELDNRFDDSTCSQVQAELTQHIETFIAG
jgi:choline-sulfatase